MKKLLIALTLLGSFIGSSWADTAIPPSIQDQFLVTLLSHVSAVTEFDTHGHTKLAFTDSVVQFGHYGNDYIVGLDAGFLGAPTGPQMTYGAHIHVFQALSKLLNINPTYAPLLAQIEADPRWSYDADVHHGVLGFTLGFVHSFQ